MRPERPDLIDYLTGKLEGRAHPEGISVPEGGGKFHTDGTVQHWPGNTFICHVDPASSAHAALRALQEEIKKSRFQRFYTFLPPSSFHMTIFQGLSPATGARCAVPRELLEASRDERTRLLRDRTGALELPTRQRARMVDLFAGKSVTMTGADQAEEDALRRTRYRLWEATGIEEPGFEAYVFHITLAYLVEWVTQETAEEIGEFSRDLTERFRDEVGTISFGQIELCNFDSMHAFERVAFLGTDQVDA